jgi:hypothetical protein
MTTPTSVPISYLSRPFPVQKTWYPNQTVSAGALNQNVRDAVNYLLAPPRCIIYASNPAQVAAQGTPSVFSFDSYLTDTDNMWDPQNPTAITFNTPGVYQIRGYLHYPYISGNGVEFHIGFAVNASGLWPIIGAPNRLCEDTRQSSGVSAFGTSCWTGGLFQFNQGDYVQLFTAQTSSGALAPAGGQFGCQVTARWVSTY